MYTDSITMRRAFIVLGVILLVFVGLWVWHYFHPPEPVTYMLQKQAETPAGINTAADRAQVTISKEQSEEIAAEIAEVPTREPDKVVNTVGKNLAQTIESERVKAEADFSIVTPVKDDKNVVPDKPGKLPAIKDDTPVNLNVYNIKAFPHHIMSVTYYDNKNYDVSWQSRVGKRMYFGPVYQQQDDKSRLGARLTVAF